MLKFVATMIAPVADRLRVATFYGIISLSPYLELIAV